MLPSSFLLLACLTRAVPPEVNGKICAAPPLLEAGMHPKQVEGPLAVDSASVKAWLQALKRFRKDCQADIGFNGSAFELDALKWTQTAYAGPQMHTYDRMFYDPALGNGTNGHGYTVDKWLADLNTRYGKIDRVILWPTYTNLGIDDRNQFELTLSCPGGVEGLSVAIEQLHHRGVHVLWAYNPWDHSTSGQQLSNETDMLELAEMMKATGADGFNGDTMACIPQSYFDDAAKIYKPVALEAEGGIGCKQDLNFDTIGWLEGGFPSFEGAVNDIPAVDVAKWLSNGKYLSVWSDRYSGSPSAVDQNSHSLTKMPAIQLQFFNGAGFCTWENVWGVWNEMISRDGEALRRTGILLRYFGKRGFLQSSEWVPHTLEAINMNVGVFASRFPSPNGKEVVWFFVNRVNSTSQGPQLLPQAPSPRYIDCYNGVDLHPDRKTGHLAFEIEAHGFGCVLATPNMTADASGAAMDQDADATNLRSGVPDAPQNLSALMKTMKLLTARKLGSFSNSWKYMPQVLVNANETAPAAPRPPNKPTSKEVYVPSASMYVFKASSVEIEGGAGSGVGSQFPWEPHPQRLHLQEMRIGAMYVEKSPVTNAEYATYLKASGYFPTDHANWLRDNFESDRKTPTSGWENKPVTYVSLEDARAYCKHFGKRLPHAYEWQYFAQSSDGRLYPWGGDADNLDLTPSVSNSFQNPGPDAVGRFPAGASPFGVEDLIRSVWQMTSEFQDLHTRSVILRGGSNYGPWRGSNETVWNARKKKYEFHPLGGSRWYFRQAFSLDTFNTYHLMSGSYDRAGTIGFRCIADAVDDCGTNGNLCINSTLVAVDGMPVAPTSPLEEMKFGGNANIARQGTLLTIKKNATNRVQGWAAAPLPTNATWTVQLTLANPDLRVLNATVVTSSGQYSTTVQVPASYSRAGGKRVLSMQYRGGPLHFTYCTADSAWSNKTLYLLKSEPVCGPGLPMYDCVTPLSTSTVVDWAHWGYPNASMHYRDPNWYQNEMAGGPGLFNPELLMPGCTNHSCNLKHTDLQFFDAKFYPTDRAIYSWDGGSPTPNARAHAGQTTKKGTFRMTIRPPKTQTTKRQAWKLTAFLGLYNTGKVTAFGNSATVSFSSPGQEPVEHTEKHAAGNNNSWKNVAVAIVFEKQVTVTYSLDNANYASSSGSVSLQAAKLEPFAHETGVEIESVAVFETTY